MSITKIRLASRLDGLTRARRAGASGASAERLTRLPGQPTLCWRNPHAAADQALQALICDPVVTIGLTAGPNPALAEARLARRRAAQPHYLAFLSITDSLVGCELGLPPVGNGRRRARTWWPPRSAVESRGGEWLTKFLVDGTVRLSVWPGRVVYRCVYLRREWKAYRVTDAGIRSARWPVAASEPGAPGR